MNREEKSDSISDDLILEILSRLPAKSIGRFRCVSKLWGSMLRKSYFTELFLTRSSARPRLLIGVQQDGEWSFYSSPQPQNLYEKTSFVVAAEFHTKFSKDISYDICGYTSGLLYFPSMQISKERKDASHVICNPITGQYASLPKLRLTYRNYGGFLGFDPIGKQFKVLFMNNIVNDEWVHYILTLGTKNVRWRKIQCPLSHDDVQRGRICISGVLYYLAYDKDDQTYLICCFDVRSEEFKFLNLNSYCSYEWSTNLINYKGKLGVFNLRYDESGGFPLKICLWVLEDVEKREWSTYVYTLRADNEVVKVNHNLSVVGMTNTGEIVLVKEKAYKPFFVFYFNPERNTLLSVEIKGVGEDHEWFNFHTVCAFVDHVEDLQFNIMKTTSIKSPPEQKRKPRSTSTSTKKDHHVKTSTSSRKGHQVSSSTSSIK